MTLVRKVKYTCALCSYCVHPGGPGPLTGGAAPASDGARRPVPVISEDRSSGTAAAGCKAAQGITRPIRNRPSTCLARSDLQVRQPACVACCAARVGCMLCAFTLALDRLVDHRRVLLLEVGVEHLATPCDVHCAHDMHRATCDMHRAALHCTPQHAPCSAALRRAAEAPGRASPASA